MQLRLDAHAKAEAPQGPARSEVLDFPRHKTVWSHSRLKTFEQCPLKFRYKYIEKRVAEEAETVEAHLGTIVHETLEKLYTDLRFQKRQSLEELLSWYHDHWKRSWSANITIVREDYGPENYEAMGEQFLRDYWKRYHPFDQAKVIGLEQRVLVSLDGHKLQGYIDRLASPADGIYEVHDYKTNATLPVEEQLKADRQLALYALAVKGMYQDARTVRLVWHFLASDKEVVLEKTDAELQRLKEETVALIERVEAAKSFPAKPSALCGWCEFKPVCPEWSHLAKTEELPANEYLKEPGVVLVNKYAELKAQEDQLAAELEKVKEALIAYANKEGYNAVAGSDTVAKIWRKDCLSFPKKGGPDYEDLVGFLKKSGKWDEVAALDTWRLEKIAESGAWPKDLLKKVLGFAVTERRERIYLKRTEGPTD